MKNNIKILKNTKNIKPDDAWKNTTKSRLIELEKNFVTKNKHSGKYRKFILFITTFYMRKKLMVALSVAFLFVSVGGSMAFLISKSGNNEISGQRRTEIIKNIIRTNAYSQAKIGAGGNSVNAALSTNVDNGTVGSIIQNKTNFLNKLILQTEKLEFGPQQCAGIQPPSSYNNSEMRRVTFNATNGDYVSKTVNILEDGRIENYYYTHSLSEGEKTKSRTLEYRGGRYALETTSTSNIVFGLNVFQPNFEDESIEELFSSMFGPDAKLYEVDRDGKKLIAIETTFNVVCDPNKVVEVVDYKTPDFWNGEDQEYRETMIGDALITLPSNENTDSKAIIIELINPENYESLGFENYVNNTNQDSLVYRNIVTSYEAIDIQNTKDAIQMAEDNMLDEIEIISNDISDEYIVDTSLPEFDKNQHADEGIKLLQKTNKKILIPRAAELGTNIFLQPDMEIPVNPNEKYYSDRNFYLEGAIGDEQLEQYKNLSASGFSILPAFASQDKVLIQNITFVADLNSNNEKFRNMNISSSVYKKEVNDFDIINSILSAPVIEKSISEIELVKGLPKAKVYSYTSKSNQLFISPKLDNSADQFNVSSQEPREVECFDNLCEQTGFIIIQDLGNAKQAISFSGLALNDYEVEFEGKTWLAINPETKDAKFSEDLVKSLDLQLIDPSSANDVTILRELILKALDIQEKMFAGSAQ